MIEQFAFIVNNQTLTFEELKANYGLYIRDIKQMAYAAWALAISKSPLIDGDTVNNRTADSREMVIEIGYNRITEIERANDALFSFLMAAADGKVTVKKTFGTVNKYITGTIREITQEVFTDKPILQIVLLTEPFWRGNVVSKELYQIGQFSDIIYSDVFVDTDNIDGQIAPCWDLTITINRNDSALSNQYIGYIAQINGVSNYGSLQLFDDIPVVYDNPTLNQIKKIKYKLSKVGKDNKFTKEVSTWGGTTTTTNIIGSIMPEAKFLKLFANSEFHFCVPEIYAPPNTQKYGWMSAILSYEPLYIR